jgi:hypothetical protein
VTFVATVTLLQAIKSPTHHPRIIIFSVTHGAGFVNLFMSESDILDSHRFPSGSGALIRRPNLSPLLRPVVFVGKSPLRPRLRFPARRHGAMSDLSPLFAQERTFVSQPLRLAGDSSTAVSRLGAPITYFSFSFLRD